MLPGGRAEGNPPVPPRDRYGSGGRACWSVRNCPVWDGPPGRGSEPAGPRRPGDPARERIVPARGGRVRVVAGMSAKARAAYPPVSARPLTGANWTIRGRRAAGGAAGLPGAPWPRPAPPGAPPGSAARRLRTGCPRRAAGGAPTVRSVARSEPSDLSAPGCGHARGGRRPRPPVLPGRRSRWRVGSGGAAPGPRGYPGPRTAPGRAVRGRGKLPGLGRPRRTAVPASEPAAAPGPPSRRGGSVTSSLPRPAVPGPAVCRACRRSGRSLSRLSPADLSPADLSPSGLLAVRPAGVGPAAVGPAAACRPLRRAPPRGTAAVSAGRARPIAARAVGAGVGAEPRPAGCRDPERGPGPRGRRVGAVRRSARRPVGPAGRSVFRSFLGAEMSKGWSPGSA